MNRDLLEIAVMFLAKVLRWISAALIVAAGFTAFGVANAFAEDLPQLEDLVYYFASFIILASACGCISAYLRERTDD